MGIDTTTPAGKALFGMMGVFAEFERSRRSRLPSLLRVRCAGGEWDHWPLPEGGFSARHRGPGGHRGRDSAPRTGAWAACLQGRGRDLLIVQWPHAGQMWEVDRITSRNAVG